MKKKFYIKTLGCKVNQYESQLIREGFLRAGYVETSKIDDSDVCVINTCTVTAASDSKSLRMIRNGLRVKDACVVVTGCMAEDKDLNLSKFKGANFIVRNKDKHRISEIVSHGSGQAAHSEKISGLRGHNRVFVKIQDGCDNICSYCKVRLVRGSSRSRDFQDVLDECYGLISSGVKEIVLTGICLGSYGKDLKKRTNLSGLIRELCGIEGEWRLRLSSIEPKDVDEDLVSRIASHKKICRHLHIPFQSGDDYILNRMKRPYRRKDYFNIVDHLKKVIPDMAISTDIMVGFPGETTEMFNNTTAFIEKVRPMRMHIFPFSKRNGTEAGRYKDNVTPGLKRDREKKLSLLAAQLSQEFIDKFIGKEIDVLVEDKREKEGNLQGYSDRYIKVSINGPDSLKNKIIQCRLTLTNSKAYGILPSYLI